MKVKSAVFPVAGMGTRMLPATKAIPKEMVTLIDKPLIQYAVEEALNGGIERIIFVTGRTKKSMEDHFDRDPALEQALEEAGKQKLLEEVNRISDMCDVVYVRQKEQKGLGHAVLCAKDIVGNDPFAVILPDDIILSKGSVIGEMAKEYERTKAPVISIMRVPMDQTHKYGIVEVKEQESERLFRLGNMVEKPKENAPSDLAIIGRYVLTPDIMDELEKTGEGAGNEIQLTDAIKTIADERGVYGYEFEGKRFDCGNMDGLIEATVNFALEREDTREGILKTIRELNLS
ncbi:UTP--glucose-1-phosphate uridylyltransferase GalU [Limisalsivibrio acetivorans]|uniref:UTP--glucose-1-phosphate uridylyltransferase GalU n=1 Tax=Limisalsivibrio acetivorans TaxID=1304888 RepID=UPI0003B40EC6|nr:UTP--glucose-1-phosphate uridylyltransferase GalU [Limisalsivibrio acetivorans]